MRRLSVHWLVPVIMALASAAAAAPAGEVRAGKELALQVCAYCHVVGADQPVPPTLSQPTPSFQDVANRPATNARSLRRFITTTHWDARTSPMTMPNPMLMDEDVNQVVAYILSLRTVGPPAPAPRVSAHQQKVDAGEYLALQLCSYCHVVSADRRYRPELLTPGPSFADIAARAGSSPKSLQRFIRSTHWDAKTLPMTMPSQSLSDEQTDEVAAYILSQRPGH
jgi:mono/diheme cytochrome c family protein